MSSWRVVTTAAELSAAVQSRAKAIDVRGEIRGMSMLVLPPGVRLRGGTLVFGSKGVCLTTDNEIEGVTIRCPDHEIAVLNDTSVPDWGTLTLRDVTTTGQVLLLARDAVMAGKVRVARLKVLSADLRGRVTRPRGFGVEVMQGAFTLWNLQPDAKATITAELLDIAAGTADKPVRGGGVFVGGPGNAHGQTQSHGGHLRVSTLRTGEIHTDGGIAPGTPDLISGGVFVISGATVDEVVNAGPVTTRGQNDMVFDNWGQVRNWTALAPVTSHGPSGVGFVNFGAIDRLDVRAPITTSGVGARGFNLYDGSLRHASFDSITTTGDGAVGLQVSRSLPILEIRGDIRTSGCEGMSLIRGVQVRLKAIALSIKPGAHIGAVHVDGQIETLGAGVVSVEIDGNVDEIQVRGGIAARGPRSDAVHVRGYVRGLGAVAVTALDGKTLVKTA